MITSLQSGDFRLGDNWVGGVAPDPLIDDFTVDTGHWMFVDEDLVIKHQAIINGVLGLTFGYPDGFTGRGHVTVQDGGWMNVTANGRVLVGGDLHFVANISEGFLLNEGSIEVAGGGYLHLSNGVMEDDAPLYINEGMITAESGGKVVIHSLVGGGAVDFHPQSTVMLLGVIARPIPLAADVWHTAPHYCNITPTKRASSIANCTPDNIKGGVVIDDVTGHYTAADIPNCTPDNIKGGVVIGDVTGHYTAADIPNCTPGNIKDGVVIGDVTGHYTAADIPNCTPGNIKDGVVIGDVTGTYDPVGAELSDFTDCYCTRSDIEARFGTANVVKWADLNNNGDAEEILERIVWAAQQATSDINDKLREAAYGVPFTAPIPKTIVDIAANLAAVYLYESRGVVDFDPSSGRPQHRLHWQRQRAEKKLNEVLAGTLVLSVDRTYSTEIECIGDDTYDEENSLGEYAE